MPQRSSYDPGTPCWTDLATTDLVGAKDFYGALLEWTSQDVPGGLGPYVLFHRDGQIAAGAMDQPQAQRDVGAPPDWTTYISVDDIEATAAAATAAGGTVHMAPMDMAESGKMAVIQDPTGAYFALWQPGSQFGAEIVNEPGGLIWNELVTDDPAAAQAFYIELFGWETETADMPIGPPYTSFKSGDEYRGGVLQKTPEMGPMPNVWNVYFAVADVNAALATVTEKGGVVHMPAMDIPGVGTMAAVADPQGASFMIMEMAQQA